MKIAVVLAVCYRKNDLFSVEIRSPDGRTGQLKPARRTGGQDTGSFDLEARHLFTGLRKDAHIGVGAQTAKI